MEALDLVNSSERWYCPCYLPWEIFGRSEHRTSAEGASVTTFSAALAVLEGRAVWPRGPLRYAASENLTLGNPHPGSGCTSGKGTVSGLLRAWNQGPSALLSRYQGHASLPSTPASWTALHPKGNS